MARTGRRELHAGVSVGKPKEKRLLEKSRSRWESNIKIYIKDIGWVGGLGLD